MKRFLVLLSSILLVAGLVPFSGFADEVKPDEPSDREALIVELQNNSYKELQAIPAYDTGKYSQNEVLVTVDLLQLGLEELSSEEMPSVLSFDGTLLEGSTARSMAADIRIDNNARFVVTLPDDVGLGEGIEVLLGIEGVVATGVNYYYTPCTTTLNDPLLSNIWGLDEVFAYDAWDIAKCDGDVAVALIDAGFDVSHEDLADNYDLVRGYDIVDDMSLSSCTTHNGGDSRLAHGTMTSGVISAVANNSTGIAGYSYDATIIPLAIGTFTNTGAVSLTAEGVYDALVYIIDLIEAGDASDLKVISMSFGGYGLYSTDIEGALDTLRDDYGVIPIAAAGNNFILDPNYPAGYDSVICVTGVDSNMNAPSGWSYTSDYATVCAPGVSIYTTTNGDAYTTSNGTSFSAPAVSSAAALLYASNQYMEPDGCQAILEATVTDLGVDGYDDFYGYGLINMEQAVCYAKFSEFSDVDLTAWPVTEGWIPYVNENGIMTGYGGSATTFGPSVTMNRAMLLTALWKMATPGWGLLPTEDNGTGFNDIPDDAWYTAAYNWAWDNNVISHSNTQGKPLNAVTRQETVQFVRLAAGAMGASTGVSGMSQPPYSDWSSIVYWAQDSAKWCYHKGVMTGYGQYFRPTSTLTRAQCAKVLAVLHRDVL